MVCIQFQVACFPFIAMFRVCKLPIILFKSILPHICSMQLTANIILVPRLKLYKDLPPYTPSYCTQTQGWLIITGTSQYVISERFEICRGAPFFAPSPLFMLCMEVRFKITVFVLYIIMLYMLVFICLWYVPYYWHFKLIFWIW
jgi:hypothetical protein